LFTAVEKPVIKTNHVSADIEKRARQLIACAVICAIVIGVSNAIAGAISSALIIIFVVFAAAAFFDFRTGVVAIILLLPISHTLLMPHELLGVTGLNPLNVLLVTCATSVILWYGINPRKIAVPRLETVTWLYMCVLLLWGVYGATHVHQIPPIYLLKKVINFYNASGYLRDIIVKPICIVMTAYLVAIAVANTRRVERFLVPLFATSLVLPTVVVGFIASGAVTLSMLAEPESRSFLSFIGTHANELGLMFNMSFALALFTAANSKSKVVRVLLFLLSAYLAASVILTFSRGAFLGLLTVCIALLIKQKRFTTIASALVLTPFLIFFIPDAVIERAATGLATGDMTAISAGRVDGIWMRLLPDLFANILIGQGPSSVLWSEAARRGTLPWTIGHPHSAYLGMVMDFGLLGAGVIIFFFIHVHRTFKEVSERTLGTVWHGYFQGANACLLLLAVQGVTDDRFTPTLPQAYLWLSFGLAIGLKHKVNQFKQLQAAI
jgi:hypothetical protein